MAWTRKYGGYDEALALLERRAEYGDLETKPKEIADRFNVKKEAPDGKTVARQHVVLADAVEQGIDVADGLSETTQKYVELVLDVRRD